MTKHTLSLPLEDTRELSKSVLKAIKFELKPTPEQEAILTGYFHAKRVVYNHFLGVEKEQYTIYKKFMDDLKKLQDEDVANGLKPRKVKAADKPKGYLSRFDLSKQFTQLRRDPDYAWLSAYSYDALALVLEDLTSAYDRFFKGQTKHPKFKNKYTMSRSIRFQGKPGRLRNDGTKAPNAIRITEIPYLDGTSPALSIPKMKEPIRIYGNHYPADNFYIRQCTITQSSSGRYFASALVEDEVFVAPLTGKAVGIDLGIINLMTLSDGQEIENPKKLIRRMKHLQRHNAILSNKERAHIKQEIYYKNGEKAGQLKQRIYEDTPREEWKNYQKQKQKVAKIHEDVAFKRKSFIHLLTQRLVEEYDVIVMEDLSVKELQQLLKGRKMMLDDGTYVSLNTMLQDGSWSEIKRQLAYKCDWYGKTLILTDPYYPANLICSSCGKTDTTVESHDTDWTCPHCDVTHHRNLNSAKNILNEGIRVYNEEALSHGDTKNVIPDLYLNNAPVKPTDTISITSLLD